MINAKAMQAESPHKSTEAQPPTKGEEIRAKIEANRLKRLRISDAMKAEAGVTGHEINTESYSGIAYLGTGKILSPEGRNIAQLYVVAHECGHIYLHNEAPGIALPAHVMELEAESYAHQALREHGMEVPRSLTDWTREYVGIWIGNDRIKGIRIDPRAEAFMRGERSPFEPLRKVPATWKLHAAAPELPVAAIRNPVPVRLRGVRRRRFTVRGLIPTRGPQRWGGLRAELKEISRLAGSSFFKGVVVGYFGLKFVHVSAPMPDYFTGPSAVPTLTAVGTIIIIALIASHMGVLWRTITRG